MARQDKRVDPTAGGANIAAQARNPLHSLASMAPVHVDWACN